MAGLGKGGDEAGGGKRDRWSAPISMKEAVLRAPVFIRLEEGDRGSEEALSFSAGDRMALEGMRVSKEGRLVMAHYTSGQEGEEEEIYRALAMLPYDMLPDISVSVLDDPKGEHYRTYVNDNFPGFSWTSVDEDEDNYSCVRIITPSTVCESTTNPTKQRRRPPPPPPGSTKPSELSAPPLPPKPVACRANLPVPVAAAGGRRYPSQEPTVNPPPIPARLHHRQQPEDDVYVIRPDELDEALINMPTLADLYSNNVPRDVMGVPIDPVKKDGEKKKKGIADAVKQTAKKVMKRVSGGQPHPSPSPTSPGTHAGDYLEVLVDDEEEDDDNGDYEVIDEDTLDDEPSQSGARGNKQSQKPLRTSEQRGERAVYESSKKKTEGKRGGKKDETKKTDKPNSAKPVVRVPPQGAGGVPLKNQSGAKTAAERPPAPLPHRLMNPGGGCMSDFVEDQRKVNSPLADLTCTELCLRLEKCGMPEVAKVCQQKCLDGGFFLLLSDEDMKKPPFSLAEFEVTTKLKMVRAGWVPKM